LSILKIYWITSRWMSCKLTILQLLLPLPSVCFSSSSCFGPTSGLQTLVIPHFYTLGKFKDSTICYFLQIFSPLPYCHHKLGHTSSYSSSPYLVNNLFLCIHAFMMACNSRWVWEFCHWLSSLDIQSIVLLPPWIRPYFGLFWCHFFHQIVPSSANQCLFFFVTYNSRQI